MGSTGPERRPRPKVFEFEFTIEGGITDEEGNKTRQVTAEFLPSVKGEKASEAHKKIVNQFACDLMENFSWGKASAGSGKAKSVSDLIKGIELHPDVTVMTRRPEGVPKKETDGYSLYVSIKQHNAWESIRS
jgi:hypothetical protein